MRHSYLLGGALLGLGVLGLAWWTGRPVPAASAPAQITLLIYSGRPDPSWSLVGGTRMLLDALARQPATSGPAPNGNLGYRGFLVRWPDAQDQPIYYIYGGVVTTMVGAQTTYLADPDRKLESWLLATADRAQVDQGLREAIRALIAAR